METPLNIPMLVRRMVLVAAISIVANLLLAAIGKNVSHTPSTFGPYMNTSIVQLTLLGVIGSGVVYGLMRKYLKDAAKANLYFVWLSIVLLVISFYPDVSMPWASDPDQVGWTYGVVANLMLMHLIAAVAAMYFYTRPE